MNKKIKVIELLNRIHDDKDIPFMIKFNGTRYIYADAEEDYRLFDNMTNEYRYFFEVIKDRYHYWLDVEVEILEAEDQEEIDIQGINENDFIIEYHSKDIFTTETLDVLFHKIALEIMRNRNKQNEILKAVKQLDKKINREE